MAPGDRGRGALLPLGHSEASDGRERTRTEHCLVRSVLVRLGENDVVVHAEHRLLTRYRVGRGNGGHAEHNRLADEVCAKELGAVLPADGELAGELIPALAAQVLDPGLVRAGGQDVDPRPRSDERSARLRGLDLRDREGVSGHRSDH